MPAPTVAAYRVVFTDGTGKLVRVHSDPEGQREFYAVVTYATNEWPERTIYSVEFVRTLTAPIDDPDWPFMDAR